MQHRSAIFPRAAVGAAIFRGGAILLARRARAPAAGLWSLPGGHVEPGEAIEDAVRRELMEETGVSADIAGLAGVRDIVHRNDRGKLLFHKVIVVFYGRWRSGEARAASDVSEVGWFETGALSSLSATEGLSGIAEEAARRLAALGHDGATLFSQK
jgi:ADP-ribose pyrophosphatase YjhB (NUDIX family)